MISSSLSGFLIGGGNLTLDGSDNSLRIAREHCANYVEVARMEPYMMTGVCQREQSWILF